MQHLAEIGAVCFLAAGLILSAYVLVLIWKWGVLRGDHALFLKRLRPTTVAILFALAGAYFLARIAHS
jgi:hypothetical protein